jgi:hypothetical protein
MARLRREAHVVEVDASIEAPQRRLRFVTDKQKAALSGISTDDIAQTVPWPTRAWSPVTCSVPQELRRCPSSCASPRAARISADLERLQVRGRAGVVKQSSPQGLDVAPRPLVPLGELGRFSRTAPIRRSTARTCAGGLRHGRAQRAHARGEVIADLVADYGAARAAGDQDWSRAPSSATAAATAGAFRRARPWSGPGRAN